MRALFSNLFRLCPTLRLSQYCSGAAYLITPSLIPKFLTATREVSPISLDDVYMTGLVREYLGISPFYLNQRYTYELDRPISWLVSKKTQPLPFIFVVSNSKDPRSVSQYLKLTGTVVILTALQEKNFYFHGSISCNFYTIK